MTHPLTTNSALSRLRKAAVAGFVSLVIAGCGGGDDSGPGPGAGASAPSRDGAGSAQTPITAPPTKACVAPQGADLPPLLNTQLDCAP